jgi:hypothetical protein
VVTARMLREAAQGAREPGEVVLTPDQADEIAYRLERFVALARSVESFVRCAGSVKAGDSWSDAEAEGLDYVVSALAQARP